MACASLPPNVQMLWDLNFLWSQLYCFAEKVIDLHLWVSAEGGESTPIIRGRPQILRNFFLTSHKQRKKFLIGKFLFCFVFSQLPKIIEVKKISEAGLGRAKGPLYYWIN